MIDIGHPAHVHYFRNFYQEMSRRGHSLTVTARDKEMTHALLRGYGIPFVSRGTGAQSALGKLINLPRCNAILLREALRFRPDVFLSFSSPYAGQVSSILRRPHIAFDDTEHAKLGRLMYAPFTDVVLSPTSYRGGQTKNQCRFEGYMELLYLHPAYFTPDPRILASVGLEPDETYSFVRFVSWAANHDIGVAGMTMEDKRKAVLELERFGRVLISSEDELPPDLRAHQIDINPADVHHLLYYASLCLGESATMASESAVLGTPAIYLDKVGRGYTDDLEARYGLVYNYDNTAIHQSRALEKAVELLADPDAAARYARRREELLARTIDVNTFLIETVEATVSARQRS